jgi:hypothetical protein
MVDAKSTVRLMARDVWRGEARQQACGNFVLTISSL